MAASVSRLVHNAINTGPAIPSGISSNASIVSRRAARNVSLHNDSADLSTFITSRPSFSVVTEVPRLDLVKTVVIAASLHELSVRTEFTDCAIPHERHPVRMRNSRQAVRDDEPGHTTRVTQELLVELQ